MSIYNQGFGGGMNPSITVTTTAGATVTVALGTKSVTAIATDGTAKISVWDYGSYSIHAALGDAVGDATVNVIAVQDYAVTVETIAPIPTVLNNATWAQIKEVAEKSQGPNYWSVGDTKQITINGKLSDGLTLSNYSTYVYIIGFDHNSGKEGTGIAFQGFKTAQSGGTDICLCDSGYAYSKSSGQWFNMNNNNSTSGGWNGCNMRNNTLPVVKATLPAELTSVIKTTTLYTDNTGGGSTSASYVTATQDELYLLAEFEIFGARHYANTAEQNYQKQYAYYAAGNSKVKYKHNSTAAKASWYERSVYATLADVFCSLNLDGTAGGYQPYDSFGLAPAFKVGGVITKPVSSLDVGNSIYIEEDGARTEYVLVHKGNPDTSRYDASCNGAWMLRKDCLGYRQWNPANQNAYEDSPIYTWLNTNYFNTLSIKDSIVEAKIPYEKYGSNGGVPQFLANGLPCKAFLLSGYELGWTRDDSLSFVVDGAKLDYFGAGNNGNSSRIARYNGNAIAWYTRSADNNGNNSTVMRVMGTGTYGAILATGQNGIRPCFIIPLDTEVEVANTSTLNFNVDTATIGTTWQFSIDKTLVSHSGDSVTVHASHPQWSSGMRTFHFVMTGATGTAVGGTTSSTASVGPSSTGGTNPEYFTDFTIDISDVTSGIVTLTITNVT